AVDHHRYRLFGKRLGNAFCQRLARDPPGKGPLGTVGKCHGDVVHALLLSLAAYQAGKVEVLAPSAQQPSSERACGLAHAILSSWHPRLIASAACITVPRAMTCEIVGGRRGNGSMASGWPGSAHSKGLRCVRTSRGHCWVRQVPVQHVAGEEPQGRRSEGGR